MAGRKRAIGVAVAAVAGKPRLALNAVKMLAQRRVDQQRRCRHQRRLRELWTVARGNLARLKNAARALRPARRPAPIGGLAVAEKPLSGKRLAHQAVAGRARDA